MKNWRIDISKNDEQFFRGGTCLCGAGGLLDIPYGKTCCQVMFCTALRPPQCIAVAVFRLYLWKWSTATSWRCPARWYRLCMDCRPPKQEKCVLYPKDTATASAKDMTKGREASEGGQREESICGRGTTWSRQHCPAVSIRAYSNELIYELVN